MAPPPGSLLGFLSLVHSVLSLAPSDHCLRLPNYNTYHTVLSVFVFPQLAKELLQVREELIYVLNRCLMNE